MTTTIEEQADGSLKLTRKPGETRGRTVILTTAEVEALKGHFRPEFERETTENLAHRVMRFLRLE